MSALQKIILKKSRLPPSAVNLSALNARLGKSRGAQRRRDYEPVGWDPYFDHSKDVTVGQNTFHVYTKGAEGPLLVLLHGGGYSGLTWAEFTKSILTMALCRIMAIDLRGHGDTHTTEEEDLSADTLASDVVAVVDSIEIAHDAPIILVGHSMGGAVAVRAAPLIPNLYGLAVIDVVEGTAMDALASMQSFLRSRPSSFSTISQAIEWCVRSGQIRNIQSAKVSVPGQIKNIETSKLATHDIDSLPTQCESNPEPVISRDDTIQEEEPSNMPPPASSAAVPTNRKYVWRIDLAKTEQHWFGWFKGLSTAFLNVSVPKMLLLAGVDRLDRELTVGQMQGKFQMQVLPACGHAVHEDVPDKVAEAIATFLVRHKFAIPASNFPRTFPAC